MRCTPHPTSTPTNGVCWPVFLPSIQTSDHGTELTLTRQLPAGPTSSAGGGVDGRGTRLGRRAATGASTAAVTPEAQAGIGTIHGATAAGEMARAARPRDRGAPD